MPSLAGVTPNRLPSSANRRSQAAASWAPPPTQYPRTAASVGRGKAASASSASTERRCGPSPPSAEASSEEMSAPAQKVSPAPVSTRARTDGSAASFARSGGSARHIAGVMALRLAGWSMTTVATPSATVWLSCGSMARMLSAPGVAHAGALGSEPGGRPDTRRYPEWPGTRTRA